MRGGRQWRHAVKDLLRQARGFASRLAACLDPVRWSIRARMTLSAILVAAVLCVIAAWLIMDNQRAHATSHRRAHVYGADLELMREFAHRTPPAVIGDEGTAHPAGRSCRAGGVGQ
ncbi:hypothetical protein [Nonomuraea sp. KM90]|uniref:hypothetical protein n=1 Tax=Nonomuraea sp. KM90 TaxID=3457428 RepID=UPI003FCEC92D